MAAIDATLPDDASEQREIARILREQPDLLVMIERAQAKAREMFPNPRFTLELIRYRDDWDPSLQMIAYSNVSREEYGRLLREFKHWLVYDLRYDNDRILITAQREHLAPSAR